MSTIVRSPMIGSLIVSFGAMGRIQSEDPKSDFGFVGDFNCHPSDWLGSNRTDSHGVAALDFATLTDCTQIVRRPTHQAGGVMDLVLINVPAWVVLRCRWWSCWSFWPFPCSVVAGHFGPCSWFWCFPGHSLEILAWLECS